MKQRVRLSVILLVVIFFISCKSNKSHENKNGQIKVEHKVANKDCKDVHWSHHKGEDGPENWSNLCDGFADCGGKSQSPINIDTSILKKSEKSGALKFSYERSGVSIINNTHTVQFNVSGNNKVNLNGKDYKLLQFHYHSLSEHTIDGKRYPLEVHFVHKHSSNDFAVIGVLFNQGEENKLFQNFLANFPKTKGKFKSSDMINLMSLFPKNKSYFSYSGSLTTPPCSEVVNWYVLQNFVSASNEQLEQFSMILNNNYRPIQALNNRIINSFTE